MRLPRPTWRTRFAAAYHGRRFASGARRVCGRSFRARLARCSSADISAACSPYNMPEIIFDCDAVLCDMDGTLVDSTASVERQWRRWAARHGLDSEPILKVAHGRRALETMREMAPHLASDADATRFDEEEAQDREGVAAIAGAAEFLAALPASRWAVVTS